MSLRHRLARSDHPAAVILKRCYRSLAHFSLPAPALVVRPILGFYVAGRTVLHFGRRVFIAEPLFKAYCTTYGQGVRTGIFVHWVQGKGRLILGDGVLVDGKCSFSFAASYVPSPTLEIGDRTEIGHGCAFAVGKSITIGRNSRISLGCVLLDSSGHPLDGEARRAGLPAPSSDVRPITIGDDVWIGQRSIILPGTQIGDGAIISAGSVVRGRVRPYTIVSGNPAQSVAEIPRTFVAQSEMKGTGS